MKNYIKKLIMSMMFLLSLGLIGCGDDSSMLLNEHYLKANFDNNYEEIKIKSENLDSDQYEVVSEKDLISITDKKSEGIDKIEYIFNINGELKEIDFRRNSKDVSMRNSNSGTFFYLDDSTMVDSMQTQCDFLNGKAISDDSVIDLDTFLLDVYATLDLNFVMHETKDYFSSLESKSNLYEFNIDENINEVSLTNLENNTVLLVKYKDKSSDDDTRLPIGKVIYSCKNGKSIEANLEKRGEVSSFKVYKDKNDEGTEVEGFQEQVNFLRNNSL